MTDNFDKDINVPSKEIIIDVCPYQGECSVSGCKRNDDGCFVRQLFEERDRAERELYRKEEELKQVSKAYEECKDSRLKAYNKLQEKEEECERLKEQINSKCFDPKSNNNRCISYNRIAEDYERDLKQLNQLKAENEELKTKIVKWLGKEGIRQTEKEKYIQSLTEIKEIAKYELNNLTESAINGGRYVEILQKCNEVLDG